MHALCTILEHVARRVDQRPPAITPNNTCILLSLRDGQLRGERVLWADDANDDDLPRVTMQSFAAPAVQLLQTTGADIVRTRDGALYDCERSSHATRTVKRLAVPEAIRSLGGRAAHQVMLTAHNHLLLGESGILYAWRSHTGPLPESLPEQPPEPLALVENGASHVALAESGRAYLFDVHRPDCSHYAVYHEKSAIGRVVDIAATCFIRSRPLASLLTASGHVHQFLSRLYCGRYCSASSVSAGGGVVTLPRDDTQPSNHPRALHEVDGCLWVRGTTQDWLVEFVGGGCMPICPAPDDCVTDGVGGDTSGDRATPAYTADHATEQRLIRSGHWALRGSIRGGHWLYRKATATA